MAEARPPLVAELVWAGGLAFGATSGGNTAIVDGDSKAGLSPMQYAAVGLAGCMSADVVDILRKGRHPVTSMRVTFTGTRAETPPRHFLRIALHFEIAGHVPADAVARAIQLSHDKYCSVWHSFRQDIELTTDFQITP
jgi:putative redox protein